MNNHERIGKALELLKAGLGPFVDREMQGATKVQRVDPAACAPSSTIRRSGAGRRDVGPSSFLRMERDGEYTWAPERPDAN